MINMFGVTAVRKPEVTVSSPAVGHVFFYRFEDTHSFFDSKNECFFFDKNQGFFEQLEFVSQKLSSSRRSWKQLFCFENVIQESRI